MKELAFGKVVRPKIIGIFSEYLFKTLQGVSQDMSTEQKQKKVFFKNSQENAYARVSFLIKLQALSIYCLMFKCKYGI